MSNWYADPVTHPYIPDYESNVPDSPHFAEDIGTPWHTQITALLPGTVEKADYQAWGGELFIKPDDTSYPEYYYYHLDDLAAGIAPGTHVNAGQYIGLSGGQTSGGDHPVTDGESTGPHTHVGYFDGYVTPPETGFTIPHGPDISPLINAAISNGIGNGGASPPPAGSVQTSTLASINPGDWATQFENWVSTNIGGFLLRVAVGGVGIGLIFLGSREVVDAMKSLPQTYQKSRGEYKRGEVQERQRKEKKETREREQESKRQQRKQEREQERVSKKEVHTKSKKQSEKVANVAKVAAA